MSEDIANLLDMTLDDLEDLPSFEPYSAGAHKVLASMEQKEVNDKVAVQLSFRYLECIELNEPQDKEPLEGDEASTMFFLDNKYGLGNLKKCAKPFCDALGFSTIREVIEGVKDVECIILTSLTQDKKNPDRQYLNVKEIMIET